MKFLLICFLGLFGLSLLGLTFLAKMARELPSPEQFTTRQVSQSTKIFDKTGQVLLYEIHGDEKRTVVPFDRIPEHAKQATIAIEDQGFYTHAALDVKSLVRAAFTDILTGTFSQGGSTITQQLAKNAFLTKDKTLTRKIKEFILANWIEKQYTKDQILNLYLNQIPYGANAYGIEAASQTYFGTSTDHITLAQSAVLAAMIQAPSYYSPWGTHTKELLERKNYVLDQMQKSGYIEEEQKKTAQDEKLTFQDKSLGSIKAPHFVMMVREYLIDKYGADTVENGGLRVITTLDWNLQKDAEEAVQKGADRNTELYNGRNAALVAEDPKTGQVLALVGSKDYFSDSEPAGCSSINNSCLFEGKFNVATQGLRQPGSSFKPFAYVAAFEKGYSPESVVFDLPTEFSTRYAKCPLTNINYNVDSPDCFHPENFDHIFRGPVNLRDGLAQSINIPSVKVLYLVGIENAIRTAESLGITTLKDRSRYGLSLVLGGGEVKLAEMVHAYATLAQDGTRHAQTAILEVQNADSEILEKYAENAEQVLSPQSVRLLNDVLSDVKARSALFQASLDLTTLPDREVALKTGTTNNYKDAWTIGYTPSLVVGVWTGNNNSQPMQRQGSSILAAVPIWHDFMSRIIDTLPVETFPVPDPIAASDRPMLNGQYLLQGNEVHDILYFVDKDDPRGPLPANPGEDSQYMNWTAPLELWAQGRGFTTVPSLLSPSSPIPSTTPTRP